MTEGTIKTTVNRTPDEVFAYLANVERAPEWVPDILEVEKLTDGPVGVGTRFHQKVRQGAVTADVTVEITEFEPGRLLAQKGEGGPASFTGRFTLQPDGDRTEITHEYTMQLSGMARMLAPVISQWVRKNTETSFTNLKRALNAEHRRA
ncbi:MAG: SRPBCC family protein [Dehalococcoidia bacterium]